MFILYTYLDVFGGQSILSDRWGHDPVPPLDPPMYSFVYV